MRLKKEGVNMYFDLMLYKMGLIDNDPSEEIFEYNIETHMSTMEILNELTRMGANEKDHILNDLYEIVKEESE